MESNPFSLTAVAQFIQAAIRSIEHVMARPYHYTESEAIDFAAAQYPVLGRERIAAAWTEYRRPARFF